MWSKRDVVLFFAGAQAFHTLSHVLIGISHTLPIEFFGISWTQSLNLFGIIFNALVTGALLWWASRL